VEWLIVNGHPMAKDFGPVVEHFAIDAAVVKERKLIEQREKQRARTRRHRRKKTC